MFNKKEMILLLEVGEPRNAGELQLKRYFRLNDYIVDDVSDNSHYWDKDIDLVVYYPHSKDSFTAEVKWDSQISDTGNLFLETQSDIDKKKDGWFNFCEADYIYYGDANKHLFYKINRVSLSMWLMWNKDRLKYRTANDYINGVLIKQSGGYLVPIEEIQDLILETIDLSQVYEEFKDI